jgi:hypothetical protein
MKNIVASDLFRRIRDKAKVVGIRRALHRVFRPRPHRLHTIGSPEPLASRHIHPPWKCNVYRKWVRNAHLLSQQIVL